MEQNGKHRGRPSPIKREHWPEMQRQERAGWTLRKIQTWLAAQGVKAGLSTVQRTLARIRADAPPPDEEPEAAPLEPASDEDELRLLRAHFWRQARDPGESSRDQQGAARLLLSIRAEKRASRPPGQKPAPDDITPQRPADPVTFN